MSQVQTVLRCDLYHFGWGMNSVQKRWAPLLRMCACICEYHCTQIPELFLPVGMRVCVVSGVTLTETNVLLLPRWRYRTGALKLVLTRRFAFGSSCAEGSDPLFAAYLEVGGCPLGTGGGNRPLGISLPPSWCVPCPFLSYLVSPREDHLFT